MDRSSTSDGTSRNVGFIARLLLETILAGHLVIAAFYWLFSPKGFYLMHSRFWLNSVIPAAVTIFMIVGLFAILKRRFEMAAICLIACTAAWIVATISGRLFFPVSLGNLWLASIFPVFIVAGGLFCLLRVVRLPVWGWLCSTLVGGGIGLFVIWAQVPPIPTTNPTGKFTASGSESGGLSVASPLEEIGEGNHFQPSMAELTVNCGSVKFRCSPLLTFDRISPDGFWSLLAPSKTVLRKIENCTRDGEGYDCRYSDGSSITVVKTDRSGHVQLNASSVVDRETFSHLNSFCELNVSGHQQLSLAFSPCKETVIDVLPADYPVGRPARFAYVDATNTFHVVEATSGEKGPFKHLASGPLKQSEPITIFFYDKGQPIASVVIEDWTSQLSTSLSPTAGWGVPENAIEFQRLHSSEASVVQLWITLAATSVGRGWECVGHHGGIYRNRMTFKIGAF